MLFRENNTFFLCVEVITIEVKAQLSFSGLQDVIIQKIEPFITTAVRTSNPAILVLSAF
jgi:hypothetical protein